MTTPRDAEPGRAPVSSLPSEARDRHDRTTTITDPVKALIEQIGIDAVYGTPVASGDATVIPVAELRTGFGYGAGPDDSDEAGGGGGAGLRMTPRGFIEMTSDGVRYRPIYDLRTVILGGAVLGWVVARLLRG